MDELAKKTDAAWRAAPRLTRLLGGVLDTLENEPVAG